MIREASRKCVLARWRNHAGIALGVIRIADTDRPTAQDRLALTKRIELFKARLSDFFRSLRGLDPFDRLESRAFPG
jgi:hypothetical protein